MPFTSPPRGVRASLRLALVFLLLVGAALTAVLVALTVSANPGYELLIGAYSVDGFAALAVGVLAWDRRPGNGTGPLLCISGFLTLVSAAGNVENEAVHTVGRVLAQALIASLLHLLLAYPSGRLRGRADVALVAAAYGLTAVLAPALRAERLNLLGLEQYPAILQNVLGLVVLGLAARRLVPRLRAAGSGQRRALAAVYGYGITTLLLLPVTAFVLSTVYGVSEIALFAVQLPIYGLYPVVIGVGLLTGTFARAGQLEELGAWLGTTDAHRPSLREALATALGDPSLEVLFRRPGGGQLIDAGGVERALPEPSSHRSAVGIDGPAGPVGMIVYDRTLLADPAPVVAAGRIVALAVDRERLVAELIASREAVRASRARIVEQGDAHRRALARDMHDVMQSRLLLAALHAGQLVEGAADAATKQAATTLRSDLDAAITELRQLVQGLMPALLVERGLVAAVADLAARIPLPVSTDLEDTGRPLPPAVTTHAYFVVAETLANVVKHSGAATASVRVARVEDVLEIDVQDDGRGGATSTGSGLRGIADRVEALGGSLQVDSPVGAGTRVEVRLPCGSPSPVVRPAP